MAYQAYRRVRLMDEDAKTFVDCWQVIWTGVQQGFVDEDEKPVPTPANYSVMFHDVDGAGNAPMYQQPSLSAPPVPEVYGPSSPAPVDA